MQIRAECPSRRLKLTKKGRKERVRRQFFPFELIMAGSAARRAVEPFVQQFLDKHSRTDAVFVGASLPEKPYSSASPRQHGLDFPGRAPPLLVPPSLRSLISSPRHANAAREFSDTAGNFLTNWRIGVLENKKGRIVPTTIPQVFVKRSLFRKHLRSASYS